MEKVIKEQSEELLEDVMKMARNAGKEDDLRELLTRIPFSTFLDWQLENARDEQYVETKVLAPHEERTATLLDRTLATIRKKKKITREQKPEIAFSVAIQIIRTRKYRDWQIELREKTFNTMLDKGLFGQEAREYKVQYKKEFESREHIYALTNANYVNLLSSTLQNHIWRIGINNTSQPLYTSDAPVVIQGHAKNPHLGVGYGSPGVEIAFPITPQIILVMCEREFFNKWKNLDCRALTLNENNVLYYNAMQVAQSQRQIYSSESNFDLALNMCNKNPILSDPKRPQIVVE